MKQKRKLGRKLLSFLLTLALVVALMPGMSLTAYADGTTYNPASEYHDYSNLISNDTEVTISEVSGQTWYVIAYDSSTVTLLSKSGFGTHKFSSNWSNVYANSEIKTYVDGLTGEGQPLAEISSVISDLTLIDTQTAQGLSPTKRKGAGTSWWLCTPSINSDYAAAFVDRMDDWNVKPGLYVNNTSGVRPALKLDLSSVIFDSESKTFSLKPAGYNVTLSGGANATISGGATSQTGLTDAMTTVTYTANTGYYFADFTDITNNGITATRTSDTVVTVSGTPTADATITVPDAVEKTAATVTKAPEAKTLIYNGSAQALVTAGTAEGGEMQYALGTKDAATEEYTASIPTATDAGTYYVWYKVVGDNGYSDSELKCVTVTITEAPAPSEDVPTGFVKDVTGTSEASGSYAFGQKIVNNDNLKTILSLSDEEVNQGTNVWLDVTELGDKVPETDKALIDGVKGDYTVGLYLDINLYKKVGNSDAVKITKSNGKVKVSILIPEKLWKSERTFEIIRIHEGVATAIPGSYDENTHVFTFETDEFSTYAIAYKDAVAPSSDSGSSPAPANTTTIPKTDGNTGLGIWYLLLAMSASVLGLLVFVRIRKEN